MPLSFTKRCKSCDRKFTATSWRALPLLKFNEEEPGLFLELRTCDCGATLGVELRGTMALRIMADEAEKQLSVAAGQVKALTKRITALLEIPTPTCEVCGRTKLQGIAHVPCDNRDKRDKRDKPKGNT